MRRPPAGERFVAELGNAPALAELVERRRDRPCRRTEQNSRTRRKSAHAAPACRAGPARPRSPRCVRQNPSASPVAAFLRCAPASCRRTARNRSRSRRAGVRCRGRPASRDPRWRPIRRLLAGRKNRIGAREHKPNVAATSTATTTARIRRAPETPPSRSAHPRSAGNTAAIGWTTAASCTQSNSWPWI